MLFRIATATLFLVTLIPCVSAQGPVGSKKRELIGQFAELIKENRIDVKVELSIDGVKTDMVKLIEDDAELNADQRAELKKVADALISNVARQIENELSNNQVLSKLGEEILIETYDRNFTEAELVQVVQFFSSPIGRKTFSFLETSKTQLSQDFKEKSEKKIQELSQPLIKEGMDALRRQVKAVKARPKTAPVR